MLATAVPASAAEERRTGCGNCSSTIGIASHTYRSTYHYATQNGATRSWYKGYTYDQGGTTYPGATRWTGRESPRP